MLHLKGFVFPRVSVVQKRIALYRIIENSSEPYTSKGCAAGGLFFKERSDEADDKNY